MGIPQTTVRSDHALALRADGVTIGKVQTWVPAQSRNATDIYEFGPAFTGEIIEVVPGNQTGQTIQVTRYDLYNSRMEEVWGKNFNITTLTDQTIALELRELWLNPIDSTPYPRSESWIYSGCWFTQLGRNHAVQGDRTVLVNAQIRYTKKYKT